MELEQVIDKFVEVGRSCQAVGEPTLNGCAREVWHRNLHRVMLQGKNSNACVFSPKSTFYSAYAMSLSSPSLFYFPTQSTAENDQEPTAPKPQPNK